MSLQFKIMAVSLLLVPQSFRTRIPVTVDERNALFNRLPAPDVVSSIPLTAQQVPSRFRKEFFWELVKPVLVQRFITLIVQSCFLAIRVPDLKEKEDQLNTFKREFSEYENALKSTLDIMVRESQTTDKSFEDALRVFDVLKSVTDSFRTDPSFAALNAADFQTHMILFHLKMESAVGKWVNEAGQILQLNLPDLAVQQQAYVKETYIPYLENQLRQTCGLDHDASIRTAFFVSPPQVSRIVSGSFLPQYVAPKSVTVSSSYDVNFLPYFPSSNRDDISSARIAGSNQNQVFESTFNRTITETSELLQTYSDHIQLMLQLLGRLTALSPLIQIGSSLAVDIVLMGVFLHTVKNCMNNSSSPIDANEQKVRLLFKKYSGIAQVLSAVLGYALGLFIQTVCVSFTKPDTPSDLFKSSDFVSILSSWSYLNSVARTTRDSFLETMKQATGNLETVAFNHTEQTAHVLMESLQAANTTCMGLADVVQTYFDTAFNQTAYGLFSEDPSQFLDRMGRYVVTNSSQSECQYFPQDIISVFDRQAVNATYPVGCGLSEMCLGLFDLSSKFELGIKKPDADFQVFIRLPSISSNPLAILSFTSELIMVRTSSVRGDVLPLSQFQQVNVSEGNFSINDRVYPLWAGNAYGPVSVTATSGTDSVQYAVVFGKAGESVSKQVVPDGSRVLGRFPDIPVQFQMDSSGFSPERPQSPALPVSCRMGVLVASATALLDNLSALNPALDTTPLKDTLRQLHQLNVSNPLPQVTIDAPSYPKIESFAGDYIKNLAQNYGWLTVAVLAQQGLGYLLPGLMQFFFTACLACQIIRIFGPEDQRRAPLFSGPLGIVRVFTQPHTNPAQTRVPDVEGGIEMQSAVRRPL